MEDITTNNKSIIDHAISRQRVIFYCLIITGSIFSVFFFWNFFYGVKLKTELSKESIRVEKKLDSLKTIDYNYDSIKLQILAIEKVKYKQVYDSLIKKIDSLREWKYYNEPINYTIFPKPNTLKIPVKTVNFSFECPKDTVNQYINLAMHFNDSSLVNEIAAIWIITTKSVQDSVKTNMFKQVELYSQFFKVRYGQNNFKIENYLKIPSTHLTVGYFLKSEIYTLETVNLYSVTCFNKVKDKRL